MFGKKDKYYEEAMKEAARKREEDKMKQRLLDREMDYAFLEELVQKMNENPLLRIKVTLTDGTSIELNTTPRKKTSFEEIVPHDELWEVK